MKLPARSDNSLFARWWWTVDHFTLSTVLIILGFGLFLVFTISPDVSGKLGYSDSLYLFKRQAVFAALAVVVMLVLSTQPRERIWQWALPGFTVVWGLVCLTLLIGVEAKGAQRWLSLAGYSLQPSEFLKPFIALSAAFLLAAKFEDESKPMFAWTALLFLFAAIPLLMQPDIGQTFLIGLMVFGQMIFAGLPWMGIVAIGLAGIGGLILVYFTMPHAAERLDRFLQPGSGGHFQAEKAREAFEHGGLYGVGPGGGTVKSSLPDAHTDYIFSVVGEEFGTLLGGGVLMLFCILVVYLLVLVLKERDSFTLLAVTGLVVQFAGQALINIGVTLAVLPTKGITLPFISYGGSSMLSLAVGVGVILALTRCNRQEKLWRQGNRLPIQRRSLYDR